MSGMPPYRSTTPIAFVYDDGLRTYKSTKPFEGVIGNLERRYRETDSMAVREELSKYLNNKPCPECGGIVEHEGGCSVCHVCGYSECA